MNTTRQGTAIQRYIQGKTRSCFTGSVKLSFECGRLLTVNEANSFGMETSKSEPDTLNQCLTKALDPLFSGSVIFVFVSGDIREYGYLQTYKGLTLDRFLGELDV